MSVRLDTLVEVTEFLMLRKKSLEAMGDVGGSYSMRELIDDFFKHFIDKETA